MSPPRKEEVVPQTASIVVFAYNFPHKKTYDMLLRLLVEGYAVTHVLAADPVKLSIPPSSVRTKIRHPATVHPSAVARRFGIPYSVVPHNAPEAEELLRSLAPDLGIITGARILKAHIIRRFSRGIVNFHPGLIPEARGLDALLWSILGDIPPGVTAHLIDEQIDAGRILIRQPMEVHEDDSIFDLSERLHDLQLEMLRPAIEAALAGEGTPLPPGSVYNRKMPPEQEAQALAKVPEYVRRFKTR